MKKIVSISLAFVMLLTGTLSANTAGGVSEVIETEVSVNSSSQLENSTSSLNKLSTPKKRGGRGGSSGKKKVWFYVVAGVFVVVLVLYVAAGGTPTLSVG